MIEQAISESNLSWEQLDAIAVTCAPGLVGALLVGVTAGKTLAMLHRKPLIGIHHLEGHLFSGFLAKPELQPPLLALLVSGGHTSLVHVRAEGNYETVGQTCDDAAGEAFDKVARLLGLGYPGGPKIDRLAKDGDANAFRLPEGKVKHPYNTSFSGLKTAVLRLVQKLEATGEPLPAADVAASFQATVARVLTKKAIACATDLQLPTIVVTGGVAANSELRRQLLAAGEQAGIDIVVPPLSLCTDNAAMIAAAAASRYEHGWRSSLDLGVRSRLKLEEIQDILYDPALLDLFSSLA